MRTNTLLERSSLNAWPALRTELYDNWVLRFAGGCTRRSNSVNVLGPSTRPLDEKIAYCEREYAREGIRPVFKCAEIPHVKRLDSRLAQAGYVREGETNVRVRSLRGPAEAAMHPVTLEAEVSRLWLQTALVAGGVAEKNHGKMESILRAIHPPHVFASVPLDHCAAAVGIAVADGDNIWICDIFTDPAYRRLGLAKSIMNGMLAWGRQVGGRTVCLQVVEGNDGAIALYDQLGFKHRYKYWYRGRPVA